MNFMLFRFKKILPVVLALTVWSCTKTYRTVVESGPEDEAAAAVVDEEGAVQEPAWTYYERLSYMFGADSTCVGIHDGMDFPDWYSGCFVNDSDRLTVNVVGDTAVIRKMLAERLGGNDFDLGVGVCPKKKQIAVRRLLREAVAEKYSGDLSSASNENGTIEIYLPGNSDSVISRFRSEVFDSPILRFNLVDEVGITPDVLQGEALYEEHESSPQFPGGEKAMLDYIYDNLKYPQDAYNKCIQGRVAVGFHVGKDGIVDSVRVIRSKDPELDAEAVRLLSIMPRFVPGKFDRTPMEVDMALPIMFNIAEYDARKARRYEAMWFDNGDDYLVEGLRRIVDEEGRIGYADSLGNTVITPRFFAGYPFEDGRAKVADYGTKVMAGEHQFWESDEWYYIDRTGRKVD